MPDRRLFLSSVAVGTISIFVPRFGSWFKQKSYLKPWTENERRYLEKQAQHAFAYSQPFSPHDYVDEDAFTKFLRGIASGRLTIREDGSVVERISGLQWP